MHVKYNLYILKVYGALRMSVKMLLMWNSRLEINGGGDTMVGTSLLEASNLMVLKVGITPLKFLFKIIIIIVCLLRYNLFLA